MSGKDYFFTCNLGFKRSVLKAVGGFDEEFAMYGEDKDLCYRILGQGGQKTFSSNMLVIHQTIFRTPKDELKRYKNYFYGKLISQIKHHQERDIQYRIAPRHMRAAVNFLRLTFLRRSRSPFSTV